MQSCSESIKANQFLKKKHSYSRLSIGNLLNSASMQYSHLLVILSSISLSSDVLAVPSAPLVPPLLLSQGSGSDFLEIEDVTQNLRVFQQLHLKRVAGAVEVRLLFHSIFTSIDTDAEAMHTLGSVSNNLKKAVNWQFIG